MSAMGMSEMGVEMSESLHGLLVGGIDGMVLAIFDPPKWKVWLWIWWAWSCSDLSRLVRSVFFRISHRGRHYYGVAPPRFEFGRIEVRIGLNRRFVRVWRRIDLRLTFSPNPEPTADRSAVGWSERGL